RTSAFHSAAARSPRSAYPRDRRSSPACPLRPPRGARRGAPSAPALSLAFRQHPSVPLLCQRRRIPPHPLQLRAFDRALAEERGEVRLRKSQQVRERRGAVLLARGEGRVGGGGLAVPGADFLTDVAAEGVAGQGEVGREGAAVVDGRVADVLLGGAG